MSSKTTPRLQLGKRIDNESLEFVEVLGVGGYGVVYRAEETNCANPRSHAVKCLLRSKEQPPVRRQFHIREIALHQLSSAHPGVVTLHRVIEDPDYTYIIMDYAPDQDLFTQILNHCRYLGNDALIKHVFLQLVDAVEYCHSLGIYHRDLKPENVLCFDNGCRVGITDFGLATTEKMSEELHTGSIYHMSPECQGGAFAIDGSYSPRSNDVWSLGIILLNLATGRNPWRTATTDDLTFQAYLRDPLNFFPSVLPVSLEINDILVQLLHVDWRQRMTMRELRQQMEDVSVFYAADVVFEGSQARCAWEARMDAERDSSVPIQDQPKAIAAKELKSPWSEDSPEIDLGGQPYIRGSTSSGVDSSPFLFQREESGAPDRGDNGLRLDRRDSWDSSNSSSYSYATTPSTPADGVLENGTGRKVEELTMEDIYDEQIRRAQVRADSGGLSAMEAGESFNRPAGARVRVRRRPGSVLDTWMHEPTGSCSTTLGSNATSSWTSPATRTSSCSTDSVFSSEITFARSTTLSLDTFAERCTPPPAEPQFSSGSRDNRSSFNPMKFFSRPSLFSSSAPKESGCQHHASGVPWSPQTCDLQPSQTALGLSQAVDASSQPESQREGESRWRIARFGPTRHWFSSVKLFSPSPVS